MRVPTMSRRSRTGRFVTAGVVVGAVAALALPTGSAAAAPAPIGGPWPRVAVSTTASGYLDMYYHSVDGELWTLQDRGSGWYGWTNLGGRLESSPAAVTIGSAPGRTWVFVVGTDRAIWYRERSGDGGPWGPWRSAGGRSAVNVPAAGCSAATGTPIVVVQGDDGAIWSRDLGLVGWRRLGGSFVGTPAAVPATGGVCPASPGTFALGEGNAVYELRAGQWRSLGGWTYDAPSPVQLAGGATDVYVQGRDMALWVNSRTAGSTAWSGWRKVGGIIGTAPAGQVWPGSAETRVVFAGAGRDSRQIWRGQNVVGSPTWSWTRVL